jgi:hypothetical protein
VKKNAKEKFGKKCTEKIGEKTRRKEISTEEIFFQKEIT